MNDVEIMSQICDDDMVIHHVLLCGEVVGWSKETDVGWRFSWQVHPQRRVGHHDDGWRGPFWTMAEDETLRLLVALALASPPETP